VFMRVAGILVFVFGIFISLNSHADGNLNIKEELSKPGVKLLVVEFYSIYCDPCMKAVPLWKKLHETYRNKGLRFIVVSADEKQCSKPLDWTPDKSICDEDFSLQKEFGVKSLPTALLYSWEGKLAMLSHHPEQTEEAIKAYFKDTNYSLKVDEVEIIGDKYAISSNPGWVREEAISQISKNSKFDVVTQSGARLSEEHGTDCSPMLKSNSILRIKLQGHDTGERMLSMKVEKDGCIKASSQQPYLGKNLNEDKNSLRMAVDRGIADILVQLVRPGKAVEAMSDSWFKKEEFIVADFSPSPKGASVMIDNKMFCKTSPCRKSVSKGMHTVTISSEKYITQTEQVNFDENKSIDWKLLQDFGWLSVFSPYKAVPVTIDGLYAGEAPLKQMEYGPGTHVISVKSDCYHPYEKTVNIERGKELLINIDPNPREGAIRVFVKDEKLNDLAAKITIEGERVGTAPGKFKVSICSKEMVLEASGFETKREYINVQEKGEASYTVNMKAHTPINQYKLWGHLTFWSGLALGGVGGMFTGLAYNEVKNYNSGTDPAKYKSKIDNYNIGAVTCYTVGGALMVTGIILWIVNPGDEAWAKSHGVTLTPTIGPNNAGVAAIGEW